MLGGVYDSCPGPLYNHFPFRNKSVHTITSYDNPEFIKFTLLSIYFTYFQYTEAKKSLLRSIFNGLSMIPKTTKNYFKYDAAKHWPGPYLGRIVLVLAFFGVYYPKSTSIFSTNLSCLDDF